MGLTVFRPSRLYRGQAPLPQRSRSQVGMRSNVGAVLARDKVDSVLSLSPNTRQPRLLFSRQTSQAIAAFPLNKPGSIEQFLPGFGFRRSSRGHREQASLQQISRPLERGLPAMRATRSQALRQTLASAGTFKLKLAKRVNNFICFYDSSCSKVKFLKSTGVIIPIFFRAHFPPSLDMS